MPLKLVRDISGISCGIWSLEESVPELAELLHDDAAAQRAVSGLGNEKRRRERVAALIVLRELAGRHLFIGHDAEGRPLVEGGNGLFISVSHSPRYVAVGVAPFPVGLDIERVSDRQLAAAGKFLSQREMSLLSYGGNRPRLAAALLWSVKEAAYKLASDVRPHFCSGIAVSGFTLATRGALDVSVISGGMEKKLVVEYDFFSDTVFVVSKYECE